MKTKWLVACVAVVCGLSVSVVAQERRGDRGRPDARAEDKPEAKGDAKPDKKEGKDAKDGKDVEKPPVVTEHDVTIGGKAIHYRVTTGLLPQMDDYGKVRANIFYIAYEKMEKAGDGWKRVDAASRPVTFTFNGGPGSSSVWLHLGAIGPRRVLFGDEGEMPTPPGTLVDNEYSWLDLTDLVFIDPVSTGFSRAAEGEDASKFHGLNEDARSVGDFIRLWLTRNDRWLSQKFLAGESYGTTRAAALSGDLQDRLGIYLNGITLISMVLNFQTLDFGPGNDEPYWLFLPTYTATAFYHKKLAPPFDKDLEKTIDEARKFAGGEYLVALSKGDTLTKAEQEAIAEKLSKLIGISKEYILLSHLRVPIQAFTKELLRDQGRSVGRLDSRYKGVDRNEVAGSPEYDPSYAAILGPFTAALNAYVRGELKYETDVNYEILTGRVRPWKFPTESSYPDVSGTLQGAISRNPDLRVAIASGYYDLATPFFASEYTVAHMGLEAGLRKNVRMDYYKSGHMMYMRKEDLMALKANAAKFYSNAP